MEDQHFFRLFSWIDHLSLFKLLKPVLYISQSFLVISMKKILPVFQKAVFLGYFFHIGKPHNLHFTRKDI